MLTFLSTHPNFLSALILSCAMAVACAVLSVLVVLRRWAFIGEGIAHAGFGGIGTAAALSLLIPAVGNEGAAFFVAVVFCLATAVAIGWISRSRAVSGDAAIGIFVAASLAWGFVAFAIAEQRGHFAQSWNVYLLGSVGNVSRAAMLAGVIVSLGVLLVLAGLSRQILLYCFDPTLAEVTGVPTGFIHYLLIVLLALMIVVGMRLAGNLLVPALLVLPGATALAVSVRLRTVVAIAIIVSLVAVVAGLCASLRWRFLPAGPAMVLVLFLEFAIAAAFRRRPATA